MGLMYHPENKEGLLDKFNDCHPIGKKKDDLDD